MANMCVSAKGYHEAEKIRFDAVEQAAAIRQAIAVAQLALNAADAISDFKKLRDVSSRAISIEESEQDHLRTVYWPAELQMLNEFTTPTVWEDQATLAKRYAGRLWPPFAAAFAREMEQLKCSKARYCGDAFKKRCEELAIQMAGARANVHLLADRIAYEEVEAVRDTDFERRKQVIAMRQGLVAQAASLMAQASSGFAGAASQAFGALNSALTALGASWADRNNAQNGVGRDPYFHTRAAGTAGATVPAGYDPGGGYDGGLSDMTGIQTMPQATVGDEVLDYGELPAFPELGVPSFEVAPSIAAAADEGWDGTGEAPSWVK
jgi:hypothetical protein